MDITLDELINIGIFLVDFATLLYLIFTGNK